MAFRITNNNVFITRGETAVYDAIFVTRRGTPLVMTKPKYDTEKYFVEFVVRKNTENRDSHLIRNFLSLTGNDSDLDIHLFDSIELIEYTGNGVWDEPPETEYENYLHYYVDLDTDKTSYKRWNGSEWVDYRFRISIPFEYADINSLKPDTYVYEINLIGGKENADKSPPIEISFKKNLLVPHEFKVGGSIGE